MRILSSIPLALLATKASAFKDTSPFFLFSTSSTFASFPSPNVVHSSTITSQLLSTLSSCPSDAYILVSQPGVSAADFAQGAGVPHLRNALNATDGLSLAAVTVPEVVGVVDVARVMAVLEGKCGARVVTADAATGEIPNQQAHPSIIKVDFPALPTSAKERIAKLSDHDSFLHAVLSTLSSSSYTVLYLTSPTSAIATPQYEMDHGYAASLAHQEFKRDLADHAAASADSRAPLFEKYVFLSPAIFMGLFATILLSMILYVGLSALSGLQVSYFAFSKEMGPSAQKRQ